MNDIKLLFDHSPWFIPLCLLGGALYSWLLYSKKSTWSKQLNLALAGLRFFLASLLLFLLLGPYLLQILNRVEKPVYVMAIDDSESLTGADKTVELQRGLAELTDLVEDLQQNDKLAETYSLENAKAEIENITFDKKRSNLNGLLKRIESDFEGKNLAGVVLLSDGIHNQGLSPAHLSYDFPVFTVGVGDTLARADIVVKNIYYNRLAYKGNKFPIVAEIFNIGYENQRLQVQLTYKGKVLQRKTVAPKTAQGITEVEFLVEALEKGLQHYAIKTIALQDELSDENNVRHAYVDIIDGKQKILLVAGAPHPDVKAIESAIQSNTNYELEVVIPKLTDNQTLLSSAEVNNFDLIILHAAPNTKSASARAIASLLNTDIPKWYILGESSDIRSFNQVNNVFEIKNYRGQQDAVGPDLNQGFNRFVFDIENQKILNNFPPVQTPYGLINLKSDSEILLKQKVGSVVTDKALLAFNTSEPRSAVLAGEGLWQWRLQEYANTGSHEVTNQIINKTIQYLSSKEDKKKLRVYPVENEVNENESVELITEIYNDIFERIYDQEINLDLTNETGQTTSYQYAIGQKSNKYRISGLASGIYNYTAKTKINGKEEVAKGQFSVKKSNLELVNLTADFGLLRSIAKNSGGRHFQVNEIGALKDLLINNEDKGLILSDKTYQSIIAMPWILGLLITLVSIEWFLRKYNGGY